MTKTKDNAPRVITTTSPEQTRAQAEALISEFPQRNFFALHGDLGSGKTCFVQGIAVALGIQENVASPTYTIANEYAGGRTLYHIDLYRIRDSGDALGIGFEEYLDSDGIVAVEWAERAADLLPDDAIHIWFKSLDAPCERQLTITLHQ